MSKKTALVLSGGGAKGAFQFAAAEYARKVKGYQWDVIAGVSVGALNGVMLAMKKYEQLDTLWKTITKERVYTGKLNFWSILKMIFGAKSIYDNEPLWKLLDDIVEPDKIAKDLDLRVGAVSLQTGVYTQFKPTDAGFKKAVLASTAIPIVWAPVSISDDYQDMVDGGLRNLSPLGDVLDTDPDEIVVINCSPRDAKEQPIPKATLRNALDIGKHSMDIAMNEIFITDLREFLRINHNVLEADMANVKLHNEDGKEYRHFECKIIEPDDHLGDTLDFSRQTLGRSMDAGRKKAEEVLG